MGGTPRHPSPQSPLLYTGKLCFSKVRCSGWEPTCGNMPVSTALMRLSGLADCFVRQSDKQFSVVACAKSPTLPEHNSFRSIWIIWIVSFCSASGWYLLWLLDCLHLYAYVSQQLHHLYPSTVLWWTDMFHNTSWMNTIRQQSLIMSFFLFVDS